VSTRSRSATVAVVVALALLTALVAAACQLPTGARPLLGLIDTSGTHYPAEVAAGIRVVTLTIAWRQAEPTAGHFDSGYAAAVRHQITVARAHHLAVVADPGLQFAPDWVFALPGGTRFKDQYGDVFSGSAPSGNDVANGVTDPAVRSAMGAYLSWLGGQIPKGELWGVRQGGGPLGELRYPGSRYGGHTDCWWAYDSSTQARSSVPGWRPGTGTTDQAKTFLMTYNANLTLFAQWLNGQFRTDFATRSLIMLPGWGQRPGTSAAVVASRLTRSTDEFNQGLDWPNQLTSLPDKAHAVAYTTYLDAALVKATPQLEPPVAYLATLAKARHLQLGGENTGTPSVAALSLSLKRARYYGLAVVNWMDEARLLNPKSGQPTLATLGAQARSLLG
jgi:hypothetical protein